MYYQSSAAPSVRALCIAKKKDDWLSEKLTDRWDWDWDTYSEREKENEREIHSLENDVNNGELFIHWRKSQNYLFCNWSN